MKDDTIEKFEFSAGHKRFCLTLITLGVVGLFATFLLDDHRAWTNMLLNSYYFVTLSACAFLILAMLYLVDAKWSEAIRHVPEAIGAFVPVGAVLMLMILPGLGVLYEWVEGAGHDSLLAAKTDFLNPAFFTFRMAAILGLWAVFAAAFRRLSPNGEDYANRKRCVALSAAFIALFGLSFILSAFDWIMSLEPHWYSTIFAIYLFSGDFVALIAVVTFVVVVLKEAGYLKAVNENHLHDLGKLLFAFVFFWAYIWFCQFLLIWYANIPEETEYFYRRLTGDWSWLFFFNLTINFIIPFLILLPRASKRSAAALKRVCILLFIGHWLDLYLLIVPGFMKADVSIGVPEVLISLGYAGLFIGVVGRALALKPLVSAPSPYMEESLHYHQ